jgi:serine/threonine-protein kinase
MSTVSVADLIKTLGQLRLLKPSQLDELTRAPNASSPRALAKNLYRRGWLTAYQIRELLQGRGRDLALGQYVLLELLGEGGMGQVFKARHRHLNRLVALKILRAERLANPDAVRRFYREIQAAAQLHHPNLVLAYDANQVGKRIFFAMEYVDGIDLYRLVKQSGPLPVPLACEYIRQAAVGLQHAFERGLVHRDIKPPNLLVTLPPGPRQTTPSSDTAFDRTPGTTVSMQPVPEGSREPVVKILDLGLACWKWSADSEPSMSLLTQEGMVIGTVDYISPEQARDSHLVDIRGDLYSLGCTFYYLLAGRPPFPDGTTVEKLLKHQTEQPFPLGVLRPDVPQEVLLVLDRLLAKRPENRYQTPAELVAALLPAATMARVSSLGGPEGSSAFAEFHPGRPVPTADLGSEFTPTRLLVTPDTIDTAVGWADIVATPPEISSQRTPPRRNERASKKWLWALAVLATILLASLFLLSSVLDRPVQPKARDGGSRSTKSKP